MRDVLERLAGWVDDGRPFALATVVRTWGSSPRPPGASMAVAADGRVVGSVSGGCVEAAVHQVALEVLAGGAPRLETYGVSDDDAFAVGLTCGGTLQVLVQRVGPAELAVVARLRAAVAARRPAALVTAVAGPAAGRLLLVEGASTAGSLGGGALDAEAAGAARGLLAHGRTAVVAVGGVDVLVEAVPPPAAMLVYGAVDHAGALVRAAVLLGYRVVVCDPRAVFATAERFPEADEVVVAWPHEHLREQTERGAVDVRSAVCVLTHDPRSDVPLLEVALRGPAAYVGAMGSRAVHRDRVAQLRERGVDDAALARLSSPIGLDLGGRTPQETAVAVLAEVVATLHGGTGARLRDVDGPLHR